MAGSQTTIRAPIEIKAPTQAPRSTSQIKNPESERVSGRQEATTGKRPKRVSDMKDDVSQPGQKSHLETLLTHPPSRIGECGP